MGEWLFKGDQTITRAEFAAVVDRMLGMEDVAKAQALQSSQTFLNHWHQVISQQLLIRVSSLVWAMEHLIPKLL